jgi:hypothetical protein
MCGGGKRLTFSTSFGGHFGPDQRTDELIAHPRREISNPEHHDEQQWHHACKRREHQS